MYVFGSRREVRGLALGFTNHPSGPHGRLAQKNGKSGPHCWRREVSTQFVQQFVTAVTAVPHVCCVGWRLKLIFIYLFSMFSLN